VGVEKSESLFAASDFEFTSEGRWDMQANHHRVGIKKLRQPPGDVAPIPGIRGTTESSIDM
jgi:hypothetical protein